MNDTAPEGDVPAAAPAGAGGGLRPPGGDGGQGIRIAVVTGASSGIGAELVRALQARGDFLDAGPERIEQVIRVNYLGSVWSTLAFLPGLGRGSHVVNLVSVAGTFAMGPYSASKHAQLAFSRSLAVELAPRGVKVHTVNPGFVETEGFPQRSRFPQALHRLIADPQLVVARLLDAVDKDKREVFVPRWYRPFGWLQALAPGLVASARARTSR